MTIPEHANLALTVFPDNDNMDWNNLKAKVKSIYEESVFASYFTLI